MSLRKEAVHVLHRELITLLPQVDEAALALGVADVLGPRIVLWVPAVQLLAAEEAADKIWLGDAAAAVEPGLGHLLRVQDEHSSNGQFLNVISLARVITISVSFTLRAIIDPILL